MSIFGKIWDKISGHSAAKAAPAPAAAAAAPVAHAAAPAAAPQVDVEAVLSIMAQSDANHGGNYQSSIVDLLKLLGLDSSLTARKELAEELGVHAGEAGTAEQNIALHKAVVAQMEAHGGRVPASMRD